MLLRVLLTFLILAPCLIRAEPTEYTIYLVGNKAGKMLIGRGMENQVSMTYSFNDRGRGPDIRAEYSLDESGLPERVEIIGVDYMKAAVAEHLVVEKGEYRWESSADAGRSTEPGFYTSLEGPPGELALLAGAALRSKDNTMKLLPVGEARVELVETRTFGDTGDRIQHLEIHGLGFEPIPIWLDGNNDLFASVSGWFSVIKAGRGELVEQLKEIQKDRREARFRAMADRATTVPDSRVLIENARVFDVVTGATVTANAVLVDGDKITALLEPDDPRPAGVQVVDAASRTLLPGLWDMHTHLDLADGPLQLAAGVTTVRDLANDHDQLMAIIQAIEDGSAVGPHVFRAGFIDGTGPFAGPTKARIENVEQAFEWIDFYAEHGYHQIKIYSSIPPQLVARMAARAHQAGLRFSGHIPAGMWAEDAVRAGYDEIQHINMVFLNFWKDIVETRNPDRFIKVAERGVDVDPETAPFREFVELLLEHATVVDPTVAVFMDLFVHTPGELAPSLKTARGRLPARVVREHLKGGLPVPAGWEERYRASAEQMLEVIGALHAAGVPLVAGTDGMAGFTLQSELQYYQDAGISAPDILKLATVGSAEVMDVADRVGSIDVGKQADLILVDGRPDENIADIVHVDWVMKDGAIIEPMVLYESLSISPVPAASGE